MKVNSTESPHQSKKTVCRCYSRSAKNEASVWLCFFVTRPPFSPPLRFLRCGFSPASESLPSALGSASASSTACIGHQAWHNPPSCPSRPSIPKHLLFPCNGFPLHAMLHHNRVISTACIVRSGNALLCCSARNTSLVWKNMC